MACCNCNDYHEFPLDWFLERVKIALKEWDVMKHTWEETKEYLNNYFKNLDVQEEINKKLDEMLSSGELVNILIKYSNVYITPTMFKTDDSEDYSLAFQKCADHGGIINLEGKRYTVNEMILLNKDCVWINGEIFCEAKQSLTELFRIDSDINATFIDLRAFTERTYSDAEFVNALKSSNRLFVNTYNSHAKINIYNVKINKFHYGIKATESYVRCVDSEILESSMGIFINTTDCYINNIYCESIAQNNLYHAVYIAGRSENRPGIIINSEFRSYASTVLQIWADKGLVDYKNININIINCVFKSGDDIGYAFSSENWLANFYNCKLKPLYKGNYNNCEIVIDDLNFHDVTISNSDITVKGSAGNMPENGHAIITQCNIKIEENSSYSLLINGKMTIKDSNINILNSNDATFRVFNAEGLTLINNYIVRDKSIDRLLIYPPSNANIWYNILNLKDDTITDNNIKK